jgi:hypothetical protein
MNNLFVLRNTQQLNARNSEIMKEKVNYRKLLARWKEVKKL